MTYSEIEQYLKGEILVMIDAANLESSVKELGWWIDYMKLRELFDTEKIVEIRDYCVHHGTESQNKFFTFLRRHGYTLITKPIKIIGQKEVEKGDVRKANFDVEIAIDAIQMQSQFDTLVLFSGDSDFDYLIKNLRKISKVVVVISSKHHIARELIESSDKFIDLRKLRSYIEREK